MTDRRTEARPRPPKGVQFDREAPIPGFTSSRSILLMPVRLETRYVDNGNELRIRIYPDQIHLDLHDPALETAELAAGQWYWQQLWPALSPNAEAASAREAIAILERTFGGPRARWITSQLTPINLSAAPRKGLPRFPTPALRPEGWQRAARLALLPDRWIASAFANGAPGGLIRVFEKAGGVIDQTLHASPDPAHTGVSASDDPKFRWTNDFDEAVRVGMAMRIRANDLDVAARKSGIGIASRLERLIVCGWRTGDSAATLGSLMTAHAHSHGLSFPSPGTPTNLTDDTPSLVVEHPSPVAEALTILNGSSLAQQTGNDTAGLITDLTWNATLGQTLDQLGDPLIGDAAIDALRDHARQWVRPDGPLPVIRVGPQPYGVLPIIASKRATGNTMIETRLNTILQRLRPFWSDASGRAPKLDRAGQDLGQNLDALFRQASLAQTLRFRRVMGPRVSELVGFNAAMKALLRATTVSILQQAEISGEPKLANMVGEDQALTLDLPWVAATENSLSALADVARAANARSKLVSRQPADSVLELLAVHALIYEIDKDAAHHAYQIMKSRGHVSALPQSIALRIEELVNLGSTPVPKGRITTGAALASLRLGKRNLPIAPGLRAALAALDMLKDRPTVELDRALRGWLDACSWRLDAWITSLATRRLAEGQSKTGPKVVQVGAFGWVESLAPDNRPDSEGFIHAPSMHHAQTAALLGSGHLSHRDESNNAFAINLSSRRVREAKALLDAVSQGVPLAEALGIRFEALVQNRAPRLVKHIRRLRAHFAANGLATIDGLALLDTRRNQTNWASRILPGAPASETRLIDACALQLEELFDAVSDLLLAEGVHQVAGGNMARAAAAFLAIDRQTQPPEIDVARTPGTGTGFDQRVMLLMGSEPPPPAWQALSNDGRSIAEPALNSWLADRIGDPAKIAIAAFTVHPASEHERPLSPVKISELRLSPLSLVILASQTTQSGNALRDHIAAALSGQLSSDELAAGVSIRIAADTPAGYELGFAEFDALLGALARAISRGRRLEPADLTASGAAPPVRIDQSQITTRANRVHDLFETARVSLTQAISSQEHLLEAIAAATRAGAEFHLSTATDLLPIAETALLKVNEALAREAAIPPSDGNATAVDHAVSRIKALLGKDFPVLPVFNGGAPEFRELWESLADQRALLGGSPLSANAVQRQMRQVRPALAGLADGLEASELVLGKAVPLMAAQLPHRPGARWISLPFGDTPPQRVKASLLVHARGIDPARPPARISGLYIDGWTEVIPDEVARTGVAIHYDAPAVRAPQSLLLAVHPETRPASWTPAILLDTITETLDLARIRAVRPQDLAPLGMALPLLYLPENATGDVPAVNLHAAKERVAKRVRARAAT